MPRIILSLTLITVVGGSVIIGGTGAFFSDTETSSDNTFAAGAIDLKVDNESYYNGLFNQGTSWEATDLTAEKFFDFLDVKPGDYGEDTISLHVETNDAYLCANVTLTSNNENGQTEPESLVDETIGEAQGELAGLVEFVFWADDGDNVFEDDEDIISQGPIGDLEVGEAYPIPLADSDENIWTDAPGPVPGNETLYLAKAWCFGKIGTAAVPTDGGDNGMNPSNNNNGNQVAGEPEDGGITCDGSFLGNESQTDSLTADVVFEAVQARHNPTFQCEEPRLPPPPPVACQPTEAYADSVVAFDQGVRKNGTPVNADRDDPTDALGAPQSLGTPFDSPVVADSFFSLGFDEGLGDGTPNEGGWIIVEFTDNIIVDGPGNDLRMWEVTGGTSYPVEKLKIEVSQDGSTWFTIASSLDRDAEADLAGSGLTWAKYVRLTDVSNRALFEATADGYDLDAFSALNCVVPQEV